MSLESVWKRTPLYVPRLPKGSKLVWSTRTIWQHRSKRLEVRIHLHSGGEQTAISYHGRINEHVRIEKGKIFEVRSTYELPPWVMPHPEEDISGREFSRRLQVVLNPPHTRQPQYLEIKKFEKDLRLLPEQDDLKAIYEGNGIWKQHS